MANEQSNQGGPTQAQADRMYKVYDKNQRGDLPRIHEIITAIFEDGREPDVKSYQLFSRDDRGTPMPREHAYKFLLDPAFRVINPRGELVPCIAKFDPSKPLTELKDNEIVVTYDELSRDGLFKRVKLIPGSEVIEHNATQDEMVNFVVKWRKSLKGMTDGDRAIAEKMASTGQDRMGSDGLDKLFGERKAA